MKRSYFLFIVCLCVYLTSSPVAGSAGGGAKPEQPALWDARQAVAFALKNNPDTAIALKRIEQAEATLMQTKAANYPQLSISGEYSQTDNSIYSFGNILTQGDFDENIDFNDPGRTDNLQLKTSLVYKLFDGGERKSNISSSRGQTRLAEIELEGIHRRLGFEVVKTYQTIIQAENMIVVRQQAIEAIDAAYGVGKARFDAGDLLKQDILNLELQQVRAQENLIQAQHVLELTRRAFLNLLGLTEGKVSINPEENVPPILPSEIHYDKRHELKMLTTMEEIAQAEIDKARGQGYPTVDAFASYQIDHGFLSDENNDSWLAGVKLNYLLFDGGNRASKLAKARLRLQEIKVMQEKTRLQLNLEVQQAKVNYQQTEKRLSVTEKMVKVAEEVARLSRARFRQGVILASDLIDYEMRLSDAKSRYLSATTGHRIAAARLLRAAGVPQFPEM